MKIKNSSDFPTHVLRRIISWCCKELDFSVRTIERAEFCNSTKYGLSGRAWGSKRFLTRIGPELLFPIVEVYAGVEIRFADRLEALVGVTAHEIYHLKQSFERLSRSRIERDAQHAARDVLDTFREERQTLVTAWQRPPDERPKTHAKSLVEKRAAIVNKKLVEWQRKLKLAQGKVRKYKVKAKYYENKCAALASMRSSEGCPKQLTTQEEVKGAHKGSFEPSMIEEHVRSRTKAKEE